MQTTFSQLNCNNYLSIILFYYVQRLSNEFQNQAKLLHNMEEQICNYEIANKKEVANRLKDQLSLLKVSF